MSAWVELQLETAAEAAELVAAAVTPFVGGIELRDSQTLIATAPDRIAVVALCAPEDEAALLAAAGDALAAARAAGTRVDPATIRRRLADEEEWRDKWKQFFRATRVGRRFVVRPSWDPGQAPPGEHVVDLDPGRAFGTGAHESTRLVIGLVEDLQERRPALARFLDLGCGSGILAIVAARLWPGAAGLAIDVDPEATACAQENLARNRVRGVDVRTGTLADAGGAYDLVMANIQADVLEDLAPGLRARLADGGVVVLSGLLAAQVDAVAAAMLRAGLALRARADEGEWAALLLETSSPG